MLQVLEAGLLTTVQDAGRPAWVHLGVPIGGACDRWALAVANAVVGNDDASAALEMTLTGATFEVLADCAFGVGGAPMDGRVDDSGTAVRPGSGIRLRAGQTLRFGAASGGARAYFALAGGIDVPDVLGSASTCLVGGFGGLDGRPLRAGDIVVGRAPDRMSVGRFEGPAALVGAQLRVLRGPHLDRLAGGTFEALVAAEYRVSGRGDRQGIRLDGPPLAATAAPMLSEGVVWGALQLPPDGQPIILLADHQTVGGYPVAAVVISADLPLLGQLAPGEPLRLVEVSRDEARRALVERRRMLAAATAVTLQ